MDDKLREALHVGRELYNQGEYERALPYLEQVSAADLPYADIYNMLGIIYHTTGQFTQARSFFEKALQINPKYVEASLNLAILHNDTGKYQEAKDLYLGAVQHAVNGSNGLDNIAAGKIANLHAEIALIYAQSGLIDAAIAEYQRALALCPHFVDIRLRLAILLRDVQRPHAALPELQLILKQNPRFVSARVHYALTLFSLGDIDAAMREMLGLLKEHPQERRFQLYLSMMQTHRQKI